MIPLDDYIYDLPGQLIAQLPSEKRDKSRLMLINKDNGKIRDSLFEDIVNYLKKDDVLILNNAKVIPARFYGYKDTGVKLEVLLLEEISPNRWEVLLKPGKRVIEGTEIVFLQKHRAVVAKVIGNGKYILDFKTKKAFLEIITNGGQIPLPPYIKYEEDKQQLYSDRYQTVYAKRAGAVAAPTAGLHFTKGLLSKLQKKGVVIEYLTLYTGLGTFKPIEAKDITKHEMHSERYELSQDVVCRINDAKKKGRRIIATGTTVVRTLEGVINKYGKLKAGIGKVDLFIYPGFKFKVIDGLITNFHLPASTLLVLVSTFAGKELTKKAYELAIKEKYRFYSFGDAMFIC